ncbi:MAG: 4Fe-4S binding protein [Anaerolineales bacterium]|nr:4Fe-4S binding protein [Anaerolineales bacterium]
MAERQRKYLIRPATRAFINEARQAEDYSLAKFIHGYVYARWIYHYIQVGRGRHWLARVFGVPFKCISKLLPKMGPDDNPLASGTMADGYHGKVLPLETAQRLISVQEDIVLRDLEKVVPYPVARDIILKNPDHIVVIDCPCRATSDNPCLPMDVCMVIGEPMTSMVREYHPQRSRLVTQEEASAILEAEHERGHVHHAFFKDAIMGRYYAICNCCSCCCAGMHAHRNGVPMLASSGYECQVQEDLCSGCESCVDICPFEAISVADGLAQVDQARCMGCGVCVSQCTQGALELARNPARGEPLEIFELIAESQV